MELVRMQLSELRANELNPRTSFKGIDELADSFEFNPKDPGEPLTPIIAVRDANVARIIDGERRYRAMKKRKKVDSCWVILCESMEDADAALSMLAVNTRENLSDEEVGRGFQQALLLGVPEETIDKLAGRPVYKALRHHADARGELETMSLDQLLAAEEFADDPAAYEMVLEESAESWRERYEYIAREKQLEEKYKEIEVVINEAVEAGLRYLVARPDQTMCEMTLFTDGAAKVIRENFQEWICENYVLVKMEGWSFWEVRSPKLDTAEPEEDIEARNAMRHTVQVAKKRRIEFIAKRLIGTGTAQLANVSDLVATHVREYRVMDVERFCTKAGIDSSNIPIHANEYVIADNWEYVDSFSNWESDKLVSGEEDDYVIRACELQADIYKALNADGYEADQDEREFIELCKKYVAEAEADA